MEKIDIHNYANRFETAKRRVSESRMSIKDKKLISDFTDECFSGGLGIARVTKYLYLLCHLSNFLKKDFKKVTEKDINAFVGRLLIGEVKKKDGEKYSDNSVEDFKKALKKFYKSKTVDMPDVVKSVKFKNIATKISPDDIWKEEDMDRIIECETDIMTRAILEILMTSGCRIGEIGNLKIKDIQFNNDETLIKLTGKTGTRAFPLYSDVHLKKWMQSHPEPDNRESPLFVLDHKKTFEENGKKIKKRVIRYITYAALLKRVESAAEKTGVKKPMNPHIFRHSVNTNLLRKNYNTEMLKKRQGWSPNSRMLSVYSHLVPEDVFAEERRIKGITKESDEKPKEIMKRCPKCNTLNKSKTFWCGMCGSPMTYDAAMRQAIASENSVKIISNVPLEDSKTFLEIVHKEKMSADDIKKAIKVIKPLVEAGILKV